jgi:cyclopropane fatty-acyl-phospholipid synthase-like methyltransferase
MTRSSPARGLQDVATYYRELAFLYQWYGGSAHGWHYGFYDRGISSHEDALVRCNEVLFEGISSQTAPSVLDVGCGEGGLTTWAAARGHHVLGITIVPEHGTLCRALAKANGVADRCAFAVMDMDSLALPDGAVDLVVNQETLCHSRDKAVYVSEVYRVLRPGGLLRMVDLAVRPGPRTRQEEAKCRAVLDGFEISSLFNATELQHNLESVGFRNIVVRDVTKRIRRTAWLILLGSIGFHLSTKAGLDGLIYGCVEAKRTRYRRHVAACVAFNYGLLHGPFCYLFGSATKPN